jgi:hypothetical protein
MLADATRFPRLETLLACLLEAFAADARAQAR